MINDQINFAGRIQFVNKKSYKNFIGYRKEINELKHHCGNNNLKHYIQYDNDYFVLTTDYAHEIKQNGVSTHVLSDVMQHPQEIAINELVRSHIEKVRNWKREIDRIPPQNIPDIEPVEQESLWQKFLKIFKKR